MQPSSNHGYKWHDALGDFEEQAMNWSPCQESMQRGSLSIFIILLMKLCNNNVEKTVMG